MKTTSKSKRRYQFSIDLAIIPEYAKREKFNLPEPPKPPTDIEIKILLSKAKYLGWNK